MKYQKLDKEEKQILTDFNQGKLKPVKQTVEFTKKQFLVLMKTVYLGNWIANAYRATGTKKDYESMEDLIFSYAYKFGFDRYVDHEARDGDRFFPTSYFESETDVDKLHDEYDEETMWDELAERLGYRDFIDKYSEAEVSKMSQDEFFTKLSDCIDAYHKEFYKHGLDRVRTKKNKQK